MSILIFFIAVYILTCIALMRLFAKAGVESWKALVPGLNFIEWCKLIGQPTWHAALLLIPIVNIFVYAGMKVDLIRSFGKMRFWQSALAVVFSPAIFWLTGKDESKYEGQVVPKEQEYLKQLNDARSNKDNRTLKALEKSPYRKGALREWAEAIFFAVFAAAFIRMFLIEAYVIPTSSMEGSLLVGDYLFVSKAHYGIRTPMTVVQVPLLHNQVPVLGTESYATKPSLPYYRLPAFQSVQRDKPFVFNWPIGDSVYITPTRSWNIEQIRQMSPPQLRQAQIPYPFDDTELKVRPLDKKDHYIKRCVAIAGDKLEIKDRQIYINDQPSKMPERVQFLYTVSGNGSLNTEELTEWGVNVEEGFQQNSTSFVFALTNENVERVKAKGFTATIFPRNENSPDIFPHDTAHYKWSVDNFGPLTVPAAGATVQLSPENIALYRRIITVYEGNRLEERGGEFYLNGSKTNSYTFKQDYYWAMGDNRHNSEDSRFWGFVPHDHIVGKPLLIWMSSGKNGIRWNRIFNSANKN